MGPNDNPTTICHVVAIPYPGRGHVNPMMNFCKLLSSKRDEILITFIVTEEWLGILSSEPKPPANIRFATIPNVIPSEIGRAADVPERGNELVNYIPGIPPTRIADLPTLFHGDGVKTVHLTCDAVSRVPKAQYLLLTSIYELESQTIDAIKSAIPTPIYSIGPSIPYFRLGDNSSLSIDSQNGENSYVQWLDSQPKSSVLYISQGSFLSVSRTQMDEIIAGVDMSGVRFLWVTRGEASRIKEGCGGKDKSIQEA
ncbi:hypothetical protein RHGRI_002580 [Rhododendron griersonianum]|uniref:UDP-glycosyltransferase n=1 Tax=Rhododendron griersonianum TaxID=479676 RepID=A0AAV6LSZ8_9ERIC|nr:hypothetical protein RHGRI_002580 [Rhododendron griersonianum]